MVGAYLNMAGGTLMSVFERKTTHYQLQYALRIAPLPAKARCFNRDYLSTSAPVDSLRVGPRSVGDGSRDIVSLRRFVVAGKHAEDSQQSRSLNRGA